MVIPTTAGETCGAREASLSVLIEICSFAHRTLTFSLIERVALYPNTKNSRYVHKCRGHTVLCQFPRAYVKDVSDAYSNIYDTQ